MTLKLALAEKGVKYCHVVTSFVPFFQDMSQRTFPREMAVPTPLLLVGCLLYLATATCGRLAPMMRRNVTVDDNHLPIPSTLHLGSSKLRKVHPGETTGAFNLNNGVMSVQLNGDAPPGGPYPCITSLWVDGSLIVPPTAVGALFQMDIRSQAGNNYNPTQSGACAGAASVLSAYEYPWEYIGGNANGILMGVTPQLFEDASGGCTNPGLAPFYFNWGVQIGDDVTFPKEAMIIVQQFWPTSASAPPIVSNLNELPTVYFGCDFAQYAFYAPTQDVTNWQPLNHPATGSNYVPGWPNGVEAIENAYGNMRCNGANPATAVCGALYSGRFLSTAGGAYNGAPFFVCNTNLVPAASYLITNTTDRLTLFAVGNQGTISAAFAQTIPLIESSWGNI